jgi:hypothetical protein
MRDSHVQSDLKDTATSATQTCEICGCFDAIEIGERHLCEQCYGGCGSCCSEQNERG